MPNGIAFDVNACEDSEPGSRNLSTSLNFELFAPLNFISSL
jgi:hypothetical protein